MGEVRATLFRGGKVLEHVTLDAEMPRHEDSGVIWVELLNPVDRDFAALQERFKLHSLAVRDAMRATQIPKVDVYDDQIFVVLKTARLRGDEIEYAGIDAFVSSRHIVTVRHERDSLPVPASDGFPTGARSTRPGSDFILHSIMDFVANGYFPVVQMIEDDVLSMEQRLLDSFLDRGEVTRCFGCGARRFICSTC